MTVPALRDACFRSQFHLSMTYRRDSSVWMPDFGPVTAAALLAPPLPKTAGQPVCHFQSNRNDGIGRIAFVAGLMQRTEVASYGTVLPTVPQAGSIAGREGRLAVMARHKFTLAFENSVSADYVTIILRPARRTRAGLPRRAECRRVCAGAALLYRRRRLQRTPDRLTT